MIFWRILGLVLYILGRVRHKTHYEWLGYYLLGSGKTKTLPRSAFSEESWKSLVCNVRRDSKWWEPRLQDEDNIYHTVGKAWVRLSPYGIVLVDHYYFYACCDLGYIHNEHTCNCDEEAREWQDIDAGSIKIRGLWLYHLVQRTYKTDNDWSNGMGTVFSKWGVTIRWGFYLAQKCTDLQGLQLDIILSDRIFADKGKPFYTTGFYPITQTEREEALGFCRAYNLNGEDI